MLLHCYHLFMLEAEVSLEMLIDPPEQSYPDNSPTLALNLCPELYGVLGSALGEQAIQHILKNNRLEETTSPSQEEQSSKSKEKVWWEEEVKSRSTSWSAYNSPKIKSVGQDNNSALMRWLMTFFPSSRSIWKAYGTSSRIILRQVKVIHEGMALMIQTAYVAFLVCGPLQEHLWLDGFTPQAYPRRP
eukprot:scaffold357956_cov59-Attheya_sp.AAC.3